MNPIFTTFLKIADASVGDPTLRTRVMQTALALAISNSSNLPSSPVESPSSYFILQIQQRAKNIVSIFNESMIIDPKAILDDVRAFWTVRYNSAHPISRQLYAKEYSFFDGLAGVGLAISPLMYVFVNDNKASILFLAATVDEIISNLGEL